MTLEALGWNAYFHDSFEPFRHEGLSPGRVAVQHRTHYLLYTEFGELKGEITGKMHYLAEGPEDFPAVGDWVAIHPRPEEQAATIHEILPRRSKFSRKNAGTRSEEQVIAANVDVVFLVSGLDNNFNLRRIERYLVLSVESGASPVIILNKSDLCDNPEVRQNEVKSVAPQVPLLVMSALEESGIEKVLAYLRPGTTGALLGSSGVGKTTIINRLLGGDVYPTTEVRESDSRGRHTTSRRELIVLPQGGILLDTPGMRELQLLGGTDGVGEVFADVRALAEQCRFRDCTHTGEPGCAIREALDDGSLEEKRLRSYLKLQREAAFQKRRNDEVEMRREKERAKKLTRMIRQIYKRKGNR